MRRSHRFGFTASLLSLALAAAACGGDDGGEAATTTSTSGGATSTSAATGSTAPTTSTTAGPQPTTLEAWEALWAKERDAIVKRIKDNGWGKSADGTTLTTRVDASSDPSRVGGDQVRRVRFENGLMVLSPPRRLFAGIMQHQELTWERIGD